MISPSVGRELRDAYRFPGFTPIRIVGTVVGDPHARVITLTRRAKKQSAERVGPRTVHGTTASAVESGTCRAATCGSISSSSCGASTAAVAEA